VSAIDFVDAFTFCRFRQNRNCSRQNGFATHKGDFPQRRKMGGKSVRSAATEGVQYSCQVFRAAQIFSAALAQLSLNVIQCLKHRVNLSYACRAQLAQIA